MRHVACFLILGLMWAVPAPANDQPNVLWIAVDDLWPHIGCYGDPQVKTPNIDRLARDGMLFTRAYAQMALCWPSRNMVFSGCRLDTLGLRDGAHTFRHAKPDIVALPQLFKNHGYYTRGLGKILHHNGQDDPVSWSEPAFMLDFHQGTYAHPDNRDCRIAMDRAANEMNPLTECADVPDNAYKDGMVADQAIETLRRVKDRPFFLAVGFHKPHTPFNAPERYWDLYERDKIRLAANPLKPKNAPDIAMNAWRYVRSFRDIPNEGPLPDEFACKVRHAYFACCSYVDAQIARLLDELDRLGLTGKTIVLMWSDHGYQLGEHGMWCKHTNFETSLRVLLVIRAPGQTHRGACCDALVELIDMYPTLAELAGLPLPDHLEGTSFVPLLADPQRPWKTAAFGQYYRRGCKGRTIRTNHFRYNEWRNMKTGDVVARELYDHGRDPMENENIVDKQEYQEATRRLSDQLKADWPAARPNLR